MLTGVLETQSHVVEHKSTSIYPQHLDFVCGAFLPTTLVILLRLFPIVDTVDLHEAGRLVQAGGAKITTEGLCVRDLYP